MARRKKIEWFEVTRRGTAHHLLVIDSVVELYRKKLLGKAHGVRWNPRYFRQYDHARWFSREDWNTYQHILQGGETKHPGYLMQLAREYERRITANRNFGKVCGKNDFSKLSSVQLARLFSEWFTHTLRFWCFAYDYILINIFLPDDVMREVEKRVPDVVAQNRFLGVLFMADRASEQWREKRALVALAQRMRARKLGAHDPRIEKALSHHVKTFAHLGLYYFRGRPYTNQRIRDRLGEYLSLPAHTFKQLQLDLHKQESNATRTQQLIRHLHLDRETIRHIRIIKRWGTLSNYVDETYGYVVNSLMPLWKELEKRLGLNWDELFSLRSQEIVSALRSGCLPRGLKHTAQSRFRGHAIALENGKVTVVDGAELAVYKRRQDTTKKLNISVSTLKGQSASPGKVRGRVRVVYTLHDLDKVERGDILVADATNPTYVPAMERAAAIVTDEGGLLSHAAIVSRELQIPCVVGTKVGTKALKDGDIVSVDAGRGIVTKV